MTPESYASRPADSVDSESSPVRVLSVLSHTGNQRVLSNWIQKQEQYEVIPRGQTGLTDAEFDVGIFDERSLREHDTAIRERKTDATVFLPVLLVNADTDGAPRDTLDRPETKPRVRQFVDEVLPTPIDTAELQRRLGTLARIRAQSMALERKTEQLLLLNRITRHDIRNEMNVVSGWTEHLTEQTDDEHDQIRRRIRDSSQHVVDLTKAVREFVDTLQTAGDPDLEAIELENVLHTELTKRRSTFGGAQFDISGEIPQVHVRANDLLASVFRNLLNNAVQHNDSDTPRVEVAVREYAETVTITVVDNGSGIPPEQRDAVLGRTEQGLDHPGAGLGLYLVDTLVTEYGGTVRIDDADLGGARVEVELTKAPSTGANTANNDA